MGMEPIGSLLSCCQTINRPSLAVRFSSDEFTLTSKPTRYSPSGLSRQRLPLNNQVFPGNLPTTLPERRSTIWPTSSGLLVSGLAGGGVGGSFSFALEPGFFAGFVFVVFFVLGSSASVTL